MSTKSEIQSLLWEAQRLYKDYRNTIEDCDKKIARLEPVYRELSEIKSDFRKTRNKTEDVFEEKGTWRGETHNKFCSSGAELDDYFETYYKKLDAAHDAINRKIGELNAKKRDLVPLVGKILGRIEKLKVEIENAVN